MSFELTDALENAILFAMEDHGGKFFLDTVEGVVTGGADAPEKPGGEAPDAGDGRFIPLPVWDSARGFKLMERFAAALRNPLVRGELTEALERGKGVFRAFKNTLGRYPEAEKLWFVFKEREMKRAILRWYNGLREEWGLEKIGEEPEETDDLVLEDFRFRPFGEEDSASARELRRSCVEEYAALLSETGAGEAAAALLKEAQAFANLPAASPDGVLTALAAETGGGDFAGYISGVVKDATLYIQNLEVKAEYRGLGVGEALLARFLDRFDPGEVCRALIDLPSRAEGFSRVLRRESFEPYATRYWLDLRRRGG